MTASLVLIGAAMFVIFLAWLDSLLPHSPLCHCEAVYRLETCPDCGRDPFDDY